MKRKAGRFLLFVAPLLFGGILVLVLATNLGGYDSTWKLSLRALNFSTPDFAPVPPDNRTTLVSMYQLNQGLRRGAHVLAYATMALLIVRAIQWGEARLKPRAVFGMLALCLLLTGAESLVRLKLATIRHFRWEQVALNLTGAGIALVLTLMFFGIKALERRTQISEPPPTD